MATIHRELPLGIKLREVFAWIGVVALGDGRGDVAEECRALVREVGDQEIDAHVPMLHLLCQACGYLRDHGDADLAAKVESVVAGLKRDVGPSVIVGSINFRGATPSEIEALFERAAKLAAARG